MADQYQVGNVTVMEINPDIIENARQIVQQELVQDQSMLEIPDYKGIFVGLSDNIAIQAISFFSEKEVRYVVGPKRI